MLHCGNPNCTAGNSIALPDSVTAQDTSLALDTSGNPVIAYKDSTNGNLNVLHCGNPNCTTGNSIVSPDPSPFSVGQSASLALDAAGNPVVSYLDSNKRVAVLRCGNPNCTSGNTIALPSEEGVVGTSLVLDGSGNPVVSYRTGNDLLVLHCGNPTCTAGNTIASPDKGGAESDDTTSLALDGLGNPVVSYRSANRRDLKVLHCGDPNCTAGNSITTPDAPDMFGDVGRDASLALDSSGNPVVSYYDQTNGDLKVLHCGDATCKNGPPDTDGDGLLDDDEVNIYFTDPLDPDTDDDLCLDGIEVGPIGGAGGQRDPLSYWDWYDQWISGGKDGSIAVGDIGAVVARFGTSRGSAPTKQEAFAEATTPPVDRTGYHASVDRGPGLAGPNPWNLTPPDGNIVVGEIGAVVAQFGHAGCGSKNP